MNKYPLKLTPVHKQTIWGGNRLKQEFLMQSSLENIAEAWMLTLRENEKNVIENGEYKGMTITEYLGGAEKFPLLIKLIDARDKLSVQVHPDDDYSLKNEGQLGKTEMWYIVDANPGATLVYGMNDKYTRKEIKEAADNGQLDEMLNFVPVEKGDLLFIPSGLVHAIGGGILIAEIQQNSDVTYRVYDYQRRDKEGNLRELHVDKALDVIKNFTSSEIDEIKFKNGENHNVDCEYFSVDIIDIKGRKELVSVGGMHLMCLNGTGEIDGYKISKGDSYFLPDGKEYLLDSDDGIKIIVSEAN